MEKKKDVTLVENGKVKIVGILTNLQLKSNSHKNWRYFDFKPSEIQETCEFDMFDQHYDNSDNGEPDIVTIIVT